MHGFDEFLGNLYHLNAEEEPENRGLPAATWNWPTARPSWRSSARAACIKCKADGKGGQTIENTRPAHQEAHGNDRRGNPRRRQGLHHTPGQGRETLLLLVERHAHALPHPREDGDTGIAGNDEYTDGMIEHDMHVGELLKLHRRPRPRQRHHRPVLHRQRPALQHLARRRHHALPQREELELGGRLPRALPSSAGPAISPPA